MKKFVSMAMVAAMTVSMVPATAFAGDDMHATAKVVNVWKVRDTEIEANKTIDNGKLKDNAPELQIKLTDVTAQGTGRATDVEFTVALDNANFISKASVEGALTLRDADGYDRNDKTTVCTFTAKLDSDKEEATITATLANGERFELGDVIALDLASVMDKVKDVYVSVESDDITISNDGEDMVYVDVMDEGITASVKKLAKVAVEEVTELEKDLKIESAVGNFVYNKATGKGQHIELKLSNGFEFVEFAGTKSGTDYKLKWVDADTLDVEVTAATDKIEIKASDIVIEAESAKEGDVATLKVKTTTFKDDVDKDTEDETYGFKATASVDVVEVTDYKVVMSVDEDEDVPVIYSGVDVANTGITDDSDHFSLEVKIEETFPGAWSMHKDFTLELPEGVYVTDVNVTGGAATLVKGKSITVDQAFEAAYRELDHKGFEFAKRTFAETEPNKDSEHELTFELELVADPGFVGDVDLKLTGDAVDEQEVTIATFATPYYVTAEQNDLKIDYRYTEVPTNVVIKEAEAGLWDEGASFTLAMEHASADFFEFEDAEVTVDEESGMEIDDKIISTNSNTDTDGGIKVTVEEESDEAATITISNMELFMSRSIPAGPYDLEAAHTTMAEAYVKQGLFAPDSSVAADHIVDKDGKLIGHDCDECEKETVVGCVADFSTVVKEAFVNVVTAGREQDDASFTTKVVVPVGESYIVAGETTVNLDVPAYVSEAGYTMLPVRAVATALGISNNNVIWNGESKTVTILYGQRIITMVAGQKTVNVNGSVIPASAAVEIVDGRTFLPMRDLATALGVTDITWDAATKTATLNGGQAE